VQRDTYKQIYIFSICIINRVDGLQNPPLHILKSLLFERIPGVFPQDVEFTKLNTTLLPLDGAGRKNRERERERKNEKERERERERERESCIAGGRNIIYEYLAGRGSGSQFAAFDVKVCKMAPRPLQ
jgi:hypothetical protein